MADPAPTPSTPPAPLPAPAEPHRHRPPTAQKVFLVAYPKVIFLYPTFFAALFAGVYMWIRPNLAGAEAYWVGSLFMTIFTINLLVFSFDFPRETSLVLVASIVALIFGLILVFRTWPILPDVMNVLRQYHPVANHMFYLTIFLVLGIIYICVGISARFDYWEVTPNELLHHHGIMADLKRFSVPNMRIDKEINDVFENLLLGSGRLILHPHNEPRAIVLDNILMINQKEAKITKMLGALKVQVERSV